MEICEFVNQKNDQIIKCKCKKNPRYGSFCNKHKSNYLVDENNFIINERFTNNIKDYLLKDLIYYYSNKINKNKKNPKNYKKQEYYDEVTKFINVLIKYKDIYSIILIQNKFRSKQCDKIKKCNNSEDFYTFDPLDKLEKKYVYIYQDLNNILWGFDIRSLKKLIEMNSKNPYTTEDIPVEIIEDINTKYELLRKNKDYENIEEIIIKDRKSSIKQKVVDLFSEIESGGISCQINWFYDLSGRRLKHLYKELEDIWNYRAQLSTEVKNRICPPNGDIFKTPISEVYQYNCKEDLQELILYNVCKFKNALTNDDKKLGYMYFIIGLATVSQDCYYAHAAWVSFV